MSKINFASNSGYLKSRSHDIVWLALVVLCLLTGVSYAKDIPGATQTSYAVTQNGTFSFQIPIVVPKGRNSVQPSLAISYSSERRQGPLGVGWGLAGLSAISRCGRTHVIDGIKGGVLHDANDKYCLGGKRLFPQGIDSQGNATYISEINDSSIITSHGSTNNLNGGTSPSYWRISRKDGSVQEYGITGSSKFKLPGTNSVHAWNLSRVKDLNGNYYQVNYRASDGLPTSIDYTIKGGIAADKQINFVYQARSDKSSRYVSGKLISKNDRLQRIEVKKGSTIVRQYKLAYQYGGVSNKSRITAVTECGLSNVCMPEIPIEWMAESGGFANSIPADKPEAAMFEHYTHQAYMQNSPTREQKERTKEINYGQWVDINGDGEIDQVIAYTDESGNKVNKVYLRNASGWSADQDYWHLPRSLRNYDDAIVNGRRGRFASGAVNQGQLVDVNGDGVFSNP